MSVVTGATGCLVKGLRLIKELWFQILGFSVAIAGAMVLTPSLRNWALSFGLIDLSDGERKLHSQAVPRLGGVVLAVAAAAGVGVVAALGGLSSVGRNSALLAAVAGGMAMHFLGLWDDIASIRARHKMVWQLAIASTVFAVGLRLDIVQLPVVGEIAFPLWVSYVCTVLWLVGVTNAFNLIDGVDGLASGIAVIALATISAIALANGHNAVALTAIVFAAAVLGFLRYNLAPATIFLGDSGSLLVGFMLASLGILAVQQPSGAVPIMVPILILGLPGLDTALAILRRFLRGQKIFSADHGHIHHRLLHMGLTPRQVCARLYGASIVLSLGALILHDQSYSQIVVLVLIAMVAVLMVYRLRFQEFEELGRLLSRQVSRDFIRRNIRIREASDRLRSAASLPDVFRVLEHAFSEDGLEASEIQLSQSYLTSRTPAATDSKGPDHRTLWSWSRHPDICAESWKVSFPLVDDSGVGFGSLIIWPKAQRGTSSPYQLNVISEHVRHELERKLLRLWWAGELLGVGKALAEPVVSFSLSRRTPLAVHKFREPSAETVA